MLHFKCNKHSCSSPECIACKFLGLQAQVSMIPVALPAAPPSIVIACAAAAAAAAHVQHVEH